MYYLRVGVKCLVLVCSLMEVRARVVQEIGECKA